MIAGNELAKSVRQFLQENGPCCAGTGGVKCVCGLSKALYEYERTKQTELPVEMILPHWAKWFCINSQGLGKISMNKPLSSSEYNFWIAVDGPSEWVGFFNKPEDWAKARWHLEDGKWVQR